MPDVLPENLLYQGVSIDIAFAEPRPGFGDLFRVCGDTHPLFPPTGDFGFERLTDLQFVQVGDFFGVRSLTNEGTDVPISLGPLVGNELVRHHPGPFDGVRLSYCVLRNPAHRVDHFLHCVERLAALGSGAQYRERGVSLGSPPDLARVRADAAAVIQHWAAEGIVVGSDDALMTEF